RADRAYLGGSTYWLMSVEFADYAVESATIDDASFESTAKEVIAATFSGEPGAKTPANGEAAAKGIDIKFSGTDHGAKVDGVMRALAYDHDLVFVVVTGAAAADPASAFASLRVVKTP